MKIKRDFALDSGLVLHLPLHEPDGNSFMSKDAYGHQCTVAGATWRPSGRYFDGVDDIITSPSNVTDFSLAGEQPFTMLIWAKPAVWATGGLASKGTANKYEWDFEFGAGPSLQFRLFTPDASANISRKIADISAYAGSWCLFGATYNGDSTHTGIGVWINGVKLDDTNPSSGLYTGQVDNGEPIRLARVWNTGAHYAGILGAVTMFKRLLSQTEIQNIYLATKWRYR